MKIQSIKISNVLSFKYYDDFSKCPEIKFASGKNDFHILIGPNGSGKSNFLEIINQIFKNILFRRCQFNKNLFLNKNSSTFEREKRNILQPLDQNISHLNKNWGCEDKSQKILLSILLNDNDYKNLDFVVDNAQAIDGYFKTYSNFGVPSFADLIGNDPSKFKKSLRNQSIDISLSRNTEGEKFAVAIEGADDTKNFIKQYFEYFEFLQSIIDIHNSENRKSTWNPLKDTFVLIGCYRNYNEVKQEHAVQDDENGALSNIRNKHYQNTTLHSRNDEPVVFELVKHKLAYKGYKLFHQEEKNKAEIVKVLYKADLYKNINDLLKKFLGISLNIEIKNSASWTFSFSVMKNGQKINFRNLSAGEKGIVHLIFALYGYDIENGLFIIDEPELHLHPQLQKKYISIAQQESKERDIQFIIATHSPVFVSEKTIESVKRFCFDKKEKTSKVVHPEISMEDKFLIKILNHTNASKIFFVDKAILVEGESDEYFFNFYINYLKENDGKIGKKIGDFEIYNIGGKGEYKKWKKFLEKWGLKVAFIGDWDNVVNFNLVSNEDLNKCKEKLKQKVIRKICQNITAKNSKDGKALLNALFAYIESKDDEKFEKLKQLALYLFDRCTPYEEIISCLKNDNKLDAINEKIKSMYSDGIYVLKSGELENYLNVPQKGLSGVAKFCNEFDASKLKDNEELKNVVNTFFND